MMESFTVRALRTLRFVSQVTLQMSPLTFAGERGMTLAELVGAINRDREHANLSSVIRLFVLGFYRDQRR
jgi:predicted DNA-binding ribbon-helix-helix protein